MPFDETKKTERYKTADGTGEVVKESTRKVAWVSIAKFIVQDAIPFARSVCSLLGFFFGGKK